MKTLVPKEVAGSPLNTEQSSYLEGWLHGLRDRGVTFADVVPQPSGPQPTDTSSLIKEERIKRELAPFEAYENLLQDARANRAPEPDNVFRYKWQGLFYLAPTHDGYMARLRIPGGFLQAFQMRELARIAQELTTGYVQVTTRANIQMRIIEPRQTPEFLRRIQAIGLHTRGAGADNVRNITASPTAGFDPLAWFDVRPLVHDLSMLILNTPAFYDLPRKFNIALDGGGAVGVVEDTNDIGIRVARLNEALEGLEPGVYFRFALGGATGHKAFASDLGILVRPDEVITLTAAILRVYLAHGNRGNRKRARLKHLLEEFPLEEFLQAVEEDLGRSLPRVPVEATQWPEAPQERGDLGVHRQAGDDLNYVGVAVPVGQLTPRQMERLADLADHYGSGEMRLTVWQNLLIPGVPTAYVETVKKALTKAGLDWKASPARSGLVACTGNAYCKYASANTKKHALELADHIDKHVPLEDPVNVHVTGCPHSCAQHYIGDIGLLATTVKVAGEPMEGYHIFVGGGYADNRAIGRQVYTGLSFENVKFTVTRMLQGFLKHRNPGETFQAFTTRHDLNQLQLIFNEDALRV